MRLWTYYLTVAVFVLFFMAARDIGKLERKVDALERRVTALEARK